MIRQIGILFVVCLCWINGAKAQNNADREANLRSLVAAERDFSRTSAEKGTRDAFLTFLADDAVVFNPLPVNGKKVWLGREKAPGVLTWTPVFADVSAASDLGFTTGPYEFRNAAGEKSVGSGYYMSVWRKDSSGGWKVALDIGTRNPPPETIPALEFPKTNAKTSNKIEVERKTLAAADENLSRLLTGEKNSAEFADLTGDYLRVHLMNHLPFTEKGAALSALRAFQGKINLQTTKIEIAQSGDFAYSYGTYEAKNQANENSGNKTGERGGSFARIWCRADDGKWKLMLVVMHDAPLQKRAESSVSQGDSKLFEYDRNAPLNVRELKAENKGKARVLDIIYASPKGGVVPAYLVLPAEKGKFPAVVYQHWGVPGANRSEFLDEAVELAASGIASILVDAPFARPELNLRLGGARDAEINLQAILDLRRAIDVLSSRPEIDSNRIAYVGHSFGASIGGVLAGIEPRFKGFVLMAGLGNQIEFMRTSTNPQVAAIRQSVPPAELERYFKSIEPFTGENYVKKAGHAPLFFQFAREDEGITPAESQRYGDAASEPKKVKFYEAKHALNDEARRDRIQWLREILSVKAADKK